MGLKLQPVRKGREGGKVLGTPGSALLALVLTYIDAPVYTTPRLRRRLGLQSARCPPRLVHTEDSNGEWQGAHARLRHRALPLLCNFPYSRTAISEADRRTFEPCACLRPNLKIKPVKGERKSSLTWALLSCSFTRIYTFIGTPTTARRCYLQRQSTHAAHPRTYIA